MAGAEKNGLRSGEDCPIMGKREKTGETDVSHREKQREEQIDEPREEKAPLG
jgi:hypothetical protein